MYVKSYDIVAYTFKAEIYCPSCIGRVVTAQPDYDGWQLAGSIQMSAEDNLNEIAAAFGIDRENESSFDSDTFPKVVFRDSLDDMAVNLCGECFQGLGE